MRFEKFSFLLLPVLVLAAVLRFAALPRRGFIYWDEATNSLEGVRVRAYFLRWVGQHVSLQVGMAVDSARPTNAVLVAISYLLLGVHDYPPLLVNAACSLATVLVTYFVGRRLFGALPALLAALFLAVSKYEIIYARSALMESDTELIFMLGVLMWLRVRRGGPETEARQVAEGLALPALLFGLAFTINFRVLPFVAGIVLVDLVRAFGTSRDSRLAVRLLVWAAGFSVFPLMWQIVGLVASQFGVAAFHMDALGDTTYWRELLYTLHEGPAGRLLFSPLPYVDWLVMREGWGITILLGCALLITLLRRSFPWFTTAVPLLVAYLTFVFAPYAYPRNVSAGLALLCLLAAAALVDLSRLLPSPRLASVVAGLVAGAIIIAGASSSWQLVSVRSGFVQAAGMLATRNDPHVIISNQVMKFYLRGSSGRCNVLDAGESGQPLASQIRAGYSFAVLDKHHQTVPGAYIRQHARRLASFLALNSSRAGEDLVATENGTTVALPGFHEYVDVYDLRNLHLKPTSGPVPRCEPNAIP